MMCTYIRGVYNDVHLYDGAPFNGAPFNGAPFNGAPFNGAPFNGALYIMVHH